jgi:lysophospholipase L1-like esterase
MKGDTIEELLRENRDFLKSLAQDVHLIAGGVNQLTERFA